MKPEGDMTWEEALAEFEEATPAEVVRPARTIDVIYQYISGRWRAAVPSIRSFAAVGATLDEVRQITRSSLRDYLDCAITLREQYWNPWHTPTQAVKLVLSPGMPLVVSQGTISVAVTTGLTEGAGITSQTLAVPVSSITITAVASSATGSEPFVVAAGQVISGTSWPQTHMNQWTTVVIAEAPNAMAGVA